MRRIPRTSQTGQVVVVTALMATVIFAAMALTVDLSLHTFNQRTLQNVTDAAALAGATDLGAMPGGAQEQQGIIDALSTIQRNLSGPPTNFPTNWAASASAITCTNSASVAGWCETVTYQTYTVKVSAPPQTANGSSNRGANDLEVDMYVNVNNNFGAFVGVATSTVGAHAVAYNSGPTNPYTYAFFSSTYVNSGNNPESIIGDVYVGNGYLPQGASKASLCISELSGAEPSSDTDSDAGVVQDDDVDDQGHVTYGVVAPTVYLPANKNGDPIYQAKPCSAGGYIAVQTKQSTTTTGTGANCPAGSQPSSDSNGLQCLAVPSPPPPPAIKLPTPNQATLPCGGSVDSSTPAGIYPVGAGCTVNLNFKTGNIQCVDLVLGVGATANVQDKGAQDYMTSWDFSPGSDPTASNAINNLSPLPPTPNTCPGAPDGATPDKSSTHVDACVVCAPPSTAVCSTPVPPGPCPMGLQNGTTGKTTSDTLFVGTIFLAGQEISFATNQSMEDVGQVYCGYWDVQTGAHPNPTVTYDAASTDEVPQTLRLVE